MKKIYMLFLMCVLVPSVFPAASSVTPEWEREQRELAEVETARQSFVRSHNDVKQGLLVGQNPEQMIERLRELMGQMAMLRERAYGDILDKYSHERERWIATYDAINVTRRRIQRMQRGIPDDE